jgi:hypothetical protein
MACPLQPVLKRTYSDFAVKSTSQGRPVAAKGSRLIARPEGKRTIQNVSGSDIQTRKKVHSIIGDRPMFCDVSTKRDTLTRLCVCGQRQIEKRTSKQANKQTKWNY